MDLGDWLRSLDLERYEAAYTVLPVGHRRKLLDAIAALRADTEPKTAPAAPKSAAQPTFATAPKAAGRTPLPHGYVL
jgi:hypothetical protein